MGEPGTHENYPRWTVFVCSSVSIAAYAIGALVIHQLGIVWLLLYLLLITGLEIRLLRTACVSCHYHGRLCAFGRGKVSALLFRRGDPRRFADKKVTLKDLLPDLVVALAPVIVGVVLLVLEFHWLILVAVISLVVLATLGNGYVRGSLACRMCKQRQMGCPAERFFARR